MYILQGHRTNDKSTSKNVAEALHQRLYHSDAWANATRPPQFVSAAASMGHVEGHQENTPEYCQERLNLYVRRCRQRGIQLPPLPFLPGSP